MLKFSSHLFPQFISAGDKTDLYDGKQTWELRKHGGQEGQRSAISWRTRSRKVNFIPVLSSLFRMEHSRSEVHLKTLW